MTLIDVLNQYIEGKSNAISTIRKISSVFDPQSAVDLLALINSITRHELGDMDKNTFKEVWGLSE